MQKTFAEVGNPFYKDVKTNNKFYKSEVKNKKEHNLHNKNKFNKNLKDNQKLKPQVSIDSKKDKQSFATTRSLSSAFNLLKYVGFAVLFLLCSKVKVLGVLQPCFYGLYLTLAFLGCNLFYLSLSYFAGSVLLNASLETITMALICCFVTSIFTLVYKKKVGNIPTWVGCVLAIVLGLPHIYFNLGSLSGIYISAINVVLNTLFMLCTNNFLKLIKIRKFNLKMNVDEVVCGCVAVALIFCGVQCLNVFSFDITKFLGILLILFSSVVFKDAFGIVLSCVLGLGASLTSGNLTYTALFCLVSLFCYIFKNYSKIYSALTTIILDLAFSLFVLQSAFSPLAFLPTILACIIFVAMPNKIINMLGHNLILNSDNDSLKNILNQNKMQVSKRLLYTSEVFYEMNKNFRSLVKGGLDIKNAKIMICNELVKSTCENCPQRAKCLKGFNSELKKIFEQLINVGFEKGKITLVDLPAYLTSRCGKLNQLILTANTLLQEYKKYTKMLGNLDASKMLIAEQLDGVSHILADLSYETKQTVVMDYKTEKLIKENLIYADIIPSEVVCFEKDEKTNVVSLIIRNIDYDNEKILSIINKICKCKMQLTEVLPNNETNLTYLSYSTAPAYDVAVGVAQTCKGGQEVCGDTHSAIKLINDKFMFALCDGMGHGEGANKTSELSINLIENFYKAGFDNQTILTSVNKLLNLGRDDVFSALDVSVIDLKNGEIDFIKQGATIGYIKRNENLNKIESNSLPLGILQEVSPKVTKTILNSDDMVIMLSDGVVDAFSEEELENYLKSLRCVNPQEMADRILLHAKNKQKNYPSDDMTVLVGKIFYNFN